MSISRRNFLKATGVAGATASLAACGATSSSVADSTSTASSSAATSEATGEKIELIMNVMQSRNTPGLTQMVEKLAAEENIHVDVQVVPDDQYDPLIKMKVQGGEAPDFIDYNQPTICGIFAPAENFLADLSAEPWVEKLVAPDNLVWTDGKYYGFPFTSVAGFQCMIYNKAVFAEAGIESVPTTKTEFDEACEKIKAIGKPPILLPSDTWVPQIWMTAGFAQAMGSNEAAADFAAKVIANEDKFSNHPELAAVIDDFGSNFTKGFFNEDWLTVAHTECVRRLAEGEAGMYYQNGVAIVSQIAESHPETELGTFMYPSEFNPDGLLSVTANSPGFSLPVDGANNDAVKRVLNLFATPEYGDLYYIDGRAGFPAIEGIDGGELSPVTTALYEEYVLAEKYVREMNNHLSDLSSLNSNGLWIYYQQVGMGELDGTQVLEKYQADIETYMKGKGAPGF